jgi:prepilin-type N-terminal cleavage/methylation domain-containing protein
MKGFTLKSVRRGFTLAEMIMAVALLALFSVFIVQMFVKADQVSRKTRTLDMAVSCASNLADQWKMNSTKGIPEQVLDMRQIREAGKTRTISLDDSFQICKAGNAVYQAVLTIEPGAATLDSLSKASESMAATAVKPDGLWTLTLVLGWVQPSDSGPIYTMQATRYFAEEVAGP